MASPADATAVQAFEEHRPRLLGLAYRLLGSTGDAEDAVQDAFLRWLRTDREEVREPYAFLVTTVTRIALDRLKSARARREEYVGPWLPEPVITDQAPFGPLAEVEQRDLISLATLRLLERLTATERGVFVLREAFDLSFDDIAAILGFSAANCRKLHERAKDHLFAERRRRTPSREEHVRLLERFWTAARGGDLEGLQALFCEDVVAWNDGGGKVRATRNPVVGRDHVARFFIGIFRKYPAAFDEVRLTEINGSPGFVDRGGGHLQAFGLDIEAGVIRGVYQVLNPDKLAYLERQLASL
jgi:RNA polymerase sigma-70 factor (ECF subfamily)